MQAWTRSLQQRLLSNYVRVVFANLSAILSAAVDDGLIGRNPCRAGSVRAPAPERRRVVPWRVEQVTTVTTALPERYQILALLAVGCGLRQGETFGLAVDDVDFLRGSAHLQAFPMVRVTLPWREPQGRPETVGLVVTARERTALARTYFNRHVWKPALEAAGMPATRDNGMHVLRHTYASVLLEDGVSIKALAEYLGHADPGLPCGPTPT